MRHHSRKSNGNPDEAPNRRPMCAIKRIVRGLAHRFDVSRGVVIASFVAGFMFVPLLTLLVLGTAWLWVDDQGKFEHRVSRAADRARTVYDRTFGSPTPRAADVETVLVGGRVVVAQGKIQTIDQLDIIHQAQKRAVELRQAAKLD